MATPYLSRKVIASIVLVTAIAIEDGRTRIKMREAAKWLKHTERYFQDALQAMVHAGILVGISGRYHSGYELGSPPKSITVKRIVEAIHAYDGREQSSISYCGGTALGDGVIKPYIEDMNERWLSDLKEKTIADFVEDAFRMGIVAVNL